MRPARHVRWTAVRDGSALALCVAVPALVVAALGGDALELDGSGNGVLVLYAVLMGGMGAGGWLAARRGPRRAPLAHAALAALAAYALVGGGGAAVRLAAGRDPEPVALVFNGLVAAVAGIAGGLLASTSGSRRRAAPADPHP